jgi:anti-sigma factor RsiW
MNRPGPHLDDRLDAWLDGRLAPDERREVERHLAECADCAGLRDALVATRRVLRTGVDDEPPPAGLEERILAALDREDVHRTGLSGAPRWRRLALPLAAGIALAVAAAVLLLRGPAGPADPVAAAFDQYATLTGTAAPPELRAATAAEVEDRWRRANLGFPARVLDLTAMGIAVVGGDATRLAGMPAARALYQGAHQGAGQPLVVCWMFPGEEADLPPPVEVRFDHGFEFRIYSRGGTTLVVWREGEVLCALAGTGDRDQVVGLAIAKAMAPPANRGVED